MDGSPASLNMAGSRNQNKELTKCSLYICFH